MKPYTTIDEYIVQFPEDTQSRLQKIREIAKKAVPKSEEGIAYAIPVINLNGKHVVYFAGYDKHISIYPIPQATAAFQKKITPYVKGKGTLQFPLDKPMPYALIKEVVEVLYKQRLQQL